MSKSGSKKKILLASLAGLVVGFSLMIAFNYMWVNSSKNESCMACHFHPESDASWKQSYHYNNDSGVMTDCAACHLPPKGSFEYVKAKISIGVKDLWAYMTKNPEDMDWSINSELEHAQTIVYNESCKACHVNIFPNGITDEGVTAHLYYEENEEKLNLQCISCHLDAGHYNPNYKHEALTSAPVTSGEIYAEATPVTSFENFTETIPGTSASINMIAIPGGSFKMGSPENEPFRNADESPQRNVTVSPFFMGELEVTWDQYWAFFNETMSEGRTSPETIYANNTREDIDAVVIESAQRGNYAKTSGITRDEQISFAGLCKMACCSLVESFENSASVTVGYSDAISGARPGARREVVESYIKRLKEMEGIALSYPGVIKTYAIQAGRELRVIVGADKLSDQESESLSHDIAKKIQDEMTYPGQVKITVIRETRSVSYAK